mgnify:CR=1 FL=1
MAESLDGSIAYDSNHAANWTSKEDKKFFVEETKKGGAIVFGQNTFKTLGDKPLPGRLNVVMTINEEDKKKEKPGSLEFFVSEKPQTVLSVLKKKGLKKIFIGGGSIINGLFFDAGLVDELWITVEPKIFGTGMRILSDKKRDINLTLKSVKKDNQTVLLKYGVNYVGSDKKRNYRCDR